MNWNIQTDLPMWLIPLGLGLVVLVAWLSYFTPRAKQLFPTWTRILLITLRSLSLLLIFILFLGPKIVRRMETDVKPLFLVAVDNSSSMKLDNDESNAANNNPILDQIPEIREILQDDFEVRTYLFGDKLQDGDSPDFNDQATDFNILFEHLTEKHYSDPVNSLLILSDGIYNQGTNPLYSSQIFPFRVHTLGYGDTTRLPDLRIREVKSNDLVYKNTRFPVEIVFDSWNLQDRSPRITVSNRGSVLLDTLAAFYEGEDTGILRLNLDAEREGVQSYSIRITGDDEEQNLNNNFYNLTVEVVEHKAKILILYSSAHPDVAALSTAIGEMEQFELESHDVKNFTGRLNQYELVIFHQIPGRGGAGATALMQEFKRERLPGWFIIGGQSDLSALNSLDLGIGFDDTGNTMEDIEGSINPSFSLFKVNPLLSAVSAEWPPLKGPLSPVNLGSRAEILLYQNIKSILLEYPLLGFTKTRTGKHAFLLGEGLWRWRLAEYLESANSDQLNTLIKSVVQYLLVDDNKEQFKLEVPRSITETQNLSITAQVYNESFEPVNDAVISFKIIDSTGTVSEYEMSLAFSGYSLELESLPPGIYSYNAETTIGQERFRKQGSINVQDVSLEDRITRADFRLLQQLANNKEGEFFTSGQYNQLLDYVGDIRPGNESVRSESKWINLISLKLLLFLIVFLLTMEWLLRRWFGTR